MQPMSQEEYFRYLDDLIEKRGQTASAMKPAVEEWQRAKITMNQYIMMAERAPDEEKRRAADQQVRIYMDRVENLLVRVNAYKSQLQMIDSNLNSAALGLRNTSVALQKEAADCRTVIDKFRQIAQLGFNPSVEQQIQTLTAKINRAEREKADADAYIEKIFNCMNGDGDNYLREKTLKRTL